MFDIFVIGKNNSNYKTIKQKFVFAKRATDVLDAQKKCLTSMFWAVWDDVEIDPAFDFDFEIPKWDEIYTHVFKNGNYWDGVCLFPAKKDFSNKEIEHRFFIDKKEIDLTISVPKKYDIFNINNYQEYQEALVNTTTDLFWVTSNNLKVADDFKFDLYFTHEEVYDRHENHAFVHKVGDNELYNGIFLLSKFKPVSEKEITYRYLISRKEWNTVASGPVQYDVFEIDTYEDYLEIMEKSKTELFWVTSNNLKVADDFKFDLYFSHDQEYDRRENHAFLHKVGNKELYNGIFLLSKFKPVSKNEIDHRYLVDKKEWNVIASGPVQYDVFEIDTYEDYQTALANTTTELFWMTSNNLKVADDFKFDLYFTHEEVYDRYENHAFLHKVGNKELYNGIFLMSKHKPVSEKEIDHRYLVDKKEWNVIASGPVQYNVFEIDSYDSYLEIMEKSKTELFWMTSKKLTAKDDFKFDLYFSHEEIYDRYENHAFLHRVNGKLTYDGIFLMSKHKPVSKNEIDHRYLVDKKEWDIIASGPKLYDIFEIDTYEDYLTAKEKTTTELFWMSSRKITPVEDFKFDIYFDDRDDEFLFERKENHAFLHKVDDKTTYDGIFLISTHNEIGKNEIEHRFLIDKKEWDIIASGPKLYDIFEIDTYEEYLTALSETTTDLFWMTSRRFAINKDFKFDLYFDDRDDEFLYERHENHAFVHKVDDKLTYDGVFLLSKHKPVSQKEIDHRFLINRKEWGIVASGPKLYDFFVADTYEEYLDALEKTTTELFWITSKNISTNKNFSFDIYFDDRDDEFLYERHENHAFLHKVEEKLTYDGVFLMSKHKPVSQKEIDHRFLINRKEWSIVASGPKLYDVFEIDSWDQYLEAFTNSSTELFWMTSKNIKIADNFDFDIFFDDRDDEQMYDRHENHAFVHRVGDRDLYNGVFLLSKQKPISQKEVENRYLIDRKEWGIVASGPVVYDKFVVDNYNDYLNAVEKSKTEMFWIIPNEVTPLDDFKFDTYFSHDDIFNRTIHHAFPHQFRDELTFNGINLVCKNKLLSEKEIEFRFVLEKKDYETVASKLKPYDVIFISYNEPNADENFNKLLSFRPDAKRVHGVKGIHNAHIKAAELSSTNMLWVVDGDAIIDESFNFSYQVPIWDKETVHVWHSRNPINDLEYGYGGVKLLPRDLTKKLDTATTDMTTSISKSFKVIDQVSNVTEFNTDPFSTWRSAFRECVKLASKSIDRQIDEESKHRLNTWSTVGTDKKFGEFAISGAKAAIKFVEENPFKLFKINDFDYLYNLYLKDTRLG